MSTSEAFIRKYLSERATPPHMMKPPEPLSDWAVNSPVMLDGHPFSFKGHEYLREPYSEAEIWHPYQVDMKSTQMGLTSRAMLKMIYGARYRGWRGILYLFPTKTDVYDFSDTRVTPLLKENPTLFGDWIRNTDSKGLKRIWSAFLYMRGMSSLAGLKGIPVDFLVIDEEDEANVKHVHAAEKRMAHSSFKEQMRLSNPSLPDWGIGAEFDRTDQRYWLLKCPRAGCGRWLNLVELFPRERGDAVPFFQEVDGVLERVCPSCTHPLDPANGEWVPSNTRIHDRVGRQYSQLWGTTITPQAIMDEYRDELISDTSFYNLTIGIPYVEAENRLSIEQVLALCGDAGMAERDRGPTSMGVDVGKILHVTVMRRNRVLLCTEVRDWGDLDQFMRNFRVGRCVVDALPETRNAREFAGKFPGKVFLSYYQEHQKGRYKWNEEDWTVSGNRTESMDASHKLLAAGELILPRRSDRMEEVAKHCHNVAKKLEVQEDAKGGGSRYVYVKLGPDHYRHSINYAVMADQYGADGAFAGMDLT